MGNTIFDITEPLPMSIFIIPFDKRFPMSKGTIDKIIPDIKEFLINNTDIDIEHDEIRKIPNNTKGISCTIDKNHFLLNNVYLTLIVTVSNLFITCYFNGNKMEIQSNN